MGAALGARDRVHLVQDHRLDPGERVPGGRGQHQEQRLGGGDQDVRRPGGQRAPLGGRGVAGADARPAPPARAGPAAPTPGGCRSAGCADCAPRPPRAPSAGTRTAPGSASSGSAGGGVEASWSRAARKAASVLPEPVGATTSTSEPSPMARHAPSWAAVGAAKAPVNQARVAGEKASRAAVGGARPCLHRAPAPLTIGLTWANGRSRACGDRRDVADNGRMSGFRGAGTALAVRGTARASTCCAPATSARPSPATPTRVRHRGRQPDGVGGLPPPGADVSAGAGALVLVNPDTPHTGRAGRARGLGVRRAVPVARAGRRDSGRDQHRSAAPPASPPHGGRPARRPPGPPGAARRRGGQRAGRRHPAAASR